MIIYTDGSCSNNGNYPNIGGYSVIVLDNKEEKILYTYTHYEQNTTNNIQELKAILYCFLKFGTKDNNNIPIVKTDSTYAINCYTVWMFKWALNDWIKSDNHLIQNKELIEAFYNYYQQGYRINLKKVPVHSGVKWNEMADKLAKGKHII